MDKFNLFCFDLDGTLIDTEPLYFRAFIDTCSYFHIPLYLSYYEYCRFAHIDNHSLRNLVTTYLGPTSDYITFSNKWAELYLLHLDDGVTFIRGADKFITRLLESKSSRKCYTCIITNTGRDTMDKILAKVPLLAQIDLILTRDCYINRKPHPEPYIRALKFFNDHNTDNHPITPIGFEDTICGITALGKSGITPVFIGSQQYLFSHHIINQFENFDVIDLNKVVTHDGQPYDHYGHFVSSSINKFINSISSCRHHFSRIITDIIPLLISSQGNLYMSGIGKCNHVCRKSVATWQSLGIPCYTLNIHDLFHGDFGTLKDNDIIIYISNSGNTDELVRCCQYIKEHFRVLQVCFTIMRNCKVSTIVDLHYTITDGTVHEIDTTNIVPTTSSLLFMSALDMIGVSLAQERGLTVENFKITHPGGELGRV